MTRRTGTEPYRLATTRAAWVKTYLDGFGRPVQTDTGHGTNTVVSSVLTEYDACACSPLGKVKKVSRPHLPGQPKVYTEYEYDAMGRTVRVIQPPNSGTTGSSGTTTYTYAGNSVTVTDPKGDYKRYYYDAFGNLVWAVDPKPGGGEYGTGYTYDLLNRLREVSMYRDGVTQIRTFGYNAQQRLETVTTPESGTTTYTYNPDGTLLRKTWANGGKVEYGYDTWKRVNAINRFMPGSPTADVCQSGTLGYDVVWNLGQAGTPAPLNRLVTRTWGNSNPAVCPGGQITERLVYNTAGQVMAKQMSVNLNGVERNLTAYWQYDKDRTTQESYPNAWNSAQEPYHPEFSFGWGYDVMNRLEHMSWFGRAPGPGNPQVSQLVGNTAVYDAAGQMTDLTIVGTNEHRTYNHLSQLTSISTGVVAQNSVNLTYQYRAAGNDGRVESMIDQSLINGVAVNETVSYGYDSLKRLKTASTTGPQWGLDFGYDAFGNLWNQTVTKGSGPQFSLSGNSATNRVGNYQYDANGNVTNDGVRTYGWDAENRLESVNGVKRYSYDPENLRVYDNGEYHFYAPDGRRLGRYVIVNGVWQTQEVFAYFNGRLIATGVPAQTTQPSGVALYPVFTDRVGSVRMSGSAAMNYYPYGQERTATANGRDKFGTYRRDALTGLDYARQRYYQSHVGRFLSPDPSGAADPADPNSWNQYAYVGGDPMNRVDTTGLSWQYVSSSFNAPNGAPAELNGTIWGQSHFLYVTFAWAGPFAPTSLSLGRALGLAGSLPGVQQYVQMSEVSAATNVFGFTHGLEHSKNILRGFRKYFYDNWSDGCVKWLNGGGLSRKEFRNRMDRIIDSMRSGQFMDFQMSRAPNGQTFGIWSHTMHGWFEVYGGNKIMMNRNAESFFNDLVLSKQQTALLHELGHIFGASGFWQNDGDYHGPSPHPNNVLVEQNCGHLLGRWFHGR